MSSVARQRMSVEEYLAFEERSETRHEFFDGEIFAMAGGMPKHAYIKENISGNLFGQLRGKPCRSASSDFRIRIEESGFHTYPDVLIHCGEPRFALDNANTLTNPTVIFEVLSPSTERYDRTFKLDQYRLIPSLKQYILVDQKTMRVEVYSPAETGWMLEAFTSPSDEVKLDASGAILKLEDIYEGIELGPPDSEPEPESGGQ